MLIKGVTGLFFVITSSPRILANARIKKIIGAAKQTYLFFMLAYPTEFVYGNFHLL